MNNFYFYIIVLLLGGSLGFFLTIFLLKKKGSNFLSDAEKMLSQAKNEASHLVFDAKKKAQKLEEQILNEEKTKRFELNKIESRLLDKESELEKKIEVQEKRREELSTKLAQIEEVKKKLDLENEMKEKELEKIAKISKQEAKDLLFEKVEKEYESELVKHLKQIEKQAKSESLDKAKMIVALAMQKYAAETASENTATIVQLPSDDLKGRIIGREGRNITAFEHATGVDVIVDETPETVILSGFDLLRRYIAKVSLERLLVDGRIHPARIEEVVKKVTEEVNLLIKDLGEKAVFETGVVGIPLELIKLLGKLKFRTSFGQNVLKHSIEVANLASIMAAELGANVSLTKKGALLHDIGKATDHDVLGHHSKIGADICKKHGLGEDIIHIVSSHHGDPEPKSLEAILVYVANLISNNRPGLDQNNLEQYVKRMSDLENLALSFNGVSMAYAVHTGSEIRVIVDSDKIDDLGCLKLANDISKKIESSVVSSNQIKVNVIRERRVEAIAE